MSHLHQKNFNNQLFLSLKNLNNQLAILFLFGILISNTTCQTSKKVSISEASRFYVGTSTNLDTEGIYAYSFNQNTGDFQEISKTTGILNPSFLSITSDNTALYAINKVAGQKASQVSAYSIDKNTGNLKLLNRQNAEGSGACYISVDATNKNVMIANYVSGSINAFPIEKNGQLGNRNSMVQHYGSSINKERQEGPHAHYIHSGIGNKIYVADLGTDKIMLYQLQKGQFKAATPSSIDLHPGAGPRHIDYSPDGKFVYIMNELEGSVSVFGYDASQNNYKNLQTISTLPVGFSKFNKSADIHVHPSGKFLYASNRGDYDSIAAFSINKKTGLLTLIEIEGEAIIWPRNFALSPNGKYLLCANLKDDSISLFSIDTQKGSLDFTGKKIMVPKPLCIKFIHH
jgi:6-phosphogluconolactonase